MKEKSCSFQGYVHIRNSRWLSGRWVVACRRPLCRHPTTSSNTIVPASTEWISIELDANPCRTDYEICPKLRHSTQCSGIFQLNPDNAIPRCRKKSVRWKRGSKNEQENLVVQHGISYIQSEHGNFFFLIKETTVARLHCSRRKRAAQGGCRGFELNIVLPAHPEGSSR